jgi:hypothetical protein
VLNTEDTPDQALKPAVLDLLRPAVLDLLSKFSSVFDAPQGLPPRRQYDHHIPLIPGARPISMPPYLIAPELKSELKRQIADLLEQGVITHNNNAFASPVILVKKGNVQDKSCRLVVDYH